MESSVSFTLRFPSGIIANCASSYSAHQYRNIRVFGAAAAAEIENAFDYDGQKLHIKRLDGKLDATTELALPHKHQFSLEIDHMAHCVRTDTQPRTPGEEGQQDQIIMAAIYEAARIGASVRLHPSTGLDAYRGPEPADT